MLLKSSSSPVTGTLFPPFSGSPTRDSDTIHGTHTNCYATHHTPFRDHKFSLSHDLHQLNLTSFPCCSSCPVRELNHEIGSFRLQGFRRAWSDSSLDRLHYTSCDKEELHSTAGKKLPHRHQGTMLHTAPSFSIFNTIDGFEGEENTRGDIGIQENEEKELNRSVTIGENIEAMGSEEFSFGKKSMGLIEEEGEGAQEEGLDGVESLGIKGTEPVSPPLYLAAGIGIEGNDFCVLGGSGGGGSHVDSILPNFDDGGDVEEYYKRMVDEYPCHPLFLSNYAQLLQSKGDLHGAEEYFHRATLADPEDGQILLQYAKLEWELHHDQDQALNNFDRAVEAAPQDSHVLAAYASFLWEIDHEGENDISQQEYQLQSGSRIEVGDPVASAETAGNLEESYRRMVGESPCNSLVLRNYAQFLCQSKGDLHGAEEYYSRAVLADPEDGEILSQYAKFLWEFLRDHNKASNYFERAVQATSGDSYVLAAYASFLWETEENEEDSKRPNGCVH